MLRDAYHGKHTGKMNEYAGSSLAWACFIFGPYSVRSVVMEPNKQRLMRENYNSLDKWPITYNQTNGKDPSTNMVWSCGADTFEGDLSKQYANGCYAEVWFRESYVGPATAPLQ